MVGGDRLAHVTAGVETVEIAGVTVHIGTPATLPTDAGKRAYIDIHGGALCPASSVATNWDSCEWCRNCDRIETALMKLLAKAGGAGIHILLYTQRPDENVIGIEPT